MAALEKVKRLEDSVTSAAGVAVKSQWISSLNRTAHDPSSIEWIRPLGTGGIASQIEENGGTNGEWTISVSQEFTGTNGFGGRVRGIATGKAKCNVLNGDVSYETCTVIYATAEG